MSANSPLIPISMVATIEATFRRLLSICFRYSIIFADIEMTEQELITLVTRNTLTRYLP
jgi:hypothetical protein